MTHKSNRRQVRSAFDINALKEICEAPFSYFAKYGTRFDLKGKERFYYYQDNGSDILAVAHLDYVHDNGDFSVAYTQSGPVIFSGALDDRLGAYIICELLPKLGMKYDILLTTDEESCRTTAGEFDTEKEYKWMIEFDRGGTDVVMYDYETPVLKQMVRASGATVGHGTYTDICALEHLGIAGFNWGVGYQEYHGPRSHAWLNDTYEMIGHFMRFAAQHSDEVIAHSQLVYDDSEYGNWKGGWPDGAVTQGGRDWRPTPYMGRNALIGSAYKHRDDIPVKCTVCDGLLTYGTCDDCGNDEWRSQDWETGDINAD